VCCRALGAGRVLDGQGGARTVELVSLFDDSDQAAAVLAEDEELIDEELGAEELVEVSLPGAGPDELDQDEEAAGAPLGLDAYPTGSLLIFSARWVPLAKVLAGMAGQLRSQGLAVVEIDVDAQAALADQLRIVSLPTFCYLAEEGPAFRTGASSMADLQELCGR